MLNTTRAHRGNRPCRAGRRIAATATLASVCGCAFLMFAVAPAQAQQLAVISPGFPLVNATTGFYAIRTSYTANVIAFSQSDGHSDTETFYPFRDEVVQVPIVTTSASYPVNSIATDSAIVHQSGHAGLGTIGGYVDVTVGDGPANAGTDLVITFLDKIHMARDNQIDITPHLDGVAQKLIVDGDPTEFVNTGAQFDAYFFSAVNDPPAAGVGFRPAYYGSATDTFEGETINATPNTTVFPAGTDWWIAGRLELRAAGNLPVETDGNGYPGVSLFAIGAFEHTAFITLDAAPDGQDGPAFTSASGIDYSSAALVPEPAAFTTAVIAAVAAAVLHRRRRSAAHLWV